MSKLADKFKLSLKKQIVLRYGENPHQEGAFYVDGIDPGFEKLWGIDLSYNNLEDANAAWRLVCDFKSPTVAVVKHSNPSGVASRSKLTDAYKLAFGADPISAYGGIVAVNESPTLEMIDAMRGKFFELMIASSYSKEVLARLKKRSEKMRVLKAQNLANNFEIKRVFDGFLVQMPNNAKETPLRWKVVSGKKPDKRTIDDLEFANKIVKHVKSNAIVIAKDLNMVGVGIGQPNRVNSVGLAIKQAGKKAKGAVLASDAFFPFDDSVKLAAKAGITIIIQPGGSIRDSEVIKTAKKLGVKMVFTGVRHFRH